MSICEQPQPNKVRHLTVRQVAERLGFGVKWVRKQVRDGTLEGYSWTKTRFSISEESVVRLENKFKIIKAKQQ